jgi:hypothetical protein
MVWKPRTWKRVGAGQAKSAEAKFSDSAQSRRGGKPASVDFPSVFQLELKAETHEPIFADAVFGGDQAHLGLLCRDPRRGGSCAIRGVARARRDCPDQQGGHCQCKRS